MEWIISADPYSETWRRILEHANHDFVEAQIIKLHGPATSNGLKENYKKQATQIRVCLLQAQEYFSASEHASIFTSFNHLYYGSVALTTAIMLLRGSGEMALDYLRKNPANSNHGLRFSTGLTPKTSSKNDSLLANSHVEIVRNGHFRNWYARLPNSEIVTCTHTTTFPGTHNVGRYVGGTQNRKSENAIIGLKWTLLELIQSVPDLFSDLARYGLNTACSRTTFTTIADGNKQTYRWIIHSAKTKVALDEILSAFQFPSALAFDFHLSTHENSVGAMVTFQSEVGTPTAKYDFR